MDVDLRIPVTAEQKKTVSIAATADQCDLAEWARRVLLKAAESEIKKRQSFSEKASRR